MVPDNVYKILKWICVLMISVLLSNIVAHPNTSLNHRNMVYQRKKPGKIYFYDPKDVSLPFFKKKIIELYYTSVSYCQQ